MTQRLQFFIAGVQKGGTTMSTHVHIDWDKVGRIGLYTVPMAAKLLGESGIKI